MQITIQRLEINGVTLAGTASMSNSPHLRLLGTDGSYAALDGDALSPDSRQIGSPSPSVSLSPEATAALAAELMELLNASGGHRINYPVNSSNVQQSAELQPVYLTDCLAIAKSQAVTMGNAESTVSQWSTLVRKWEEHHHGPGPTVTEIGDGDFAEFANSRSEWSVETRERNWQYFERLLKTQMPLSNKNQFGCDRDSSLLTELPYRGTLATSARDQLAAEPEDRSYSVEECGRLIDAWGTSYSTFPTSEHAGPRSPATQLVDPEIVAAGLFGMLWLGGARRCDGYQMSLDSWRPETSEIVYRDSKTRSRTAKKLKRKSIHVPAPDWLSPILALLAHDAQQCGRSTLFPLCNPDGYEPLSPRTMTKHLRRVYELAEVSPIKDARGRCEWFGGFRKSAVTEWLDHDDTLQEFITGHADARSISKVHYARMLTKARAAAEQYPHPEQLDRIAARCRALLDTQAT